MLKSFFSSKAQPESTLSFGKMLNTKYNGMLCTKITPKSGTTTKYNILKEYSHPNIIPIYKTSQHSVYTKKIDNFIKFYDQSKLEYNRYVILKLRKALEFIHTVIKKEHQAISMDSIVVTDSGEIMISNFDKSIDFSSSTVDNEMLDTLSLEMTGKRAENICGVSDIFDAVLKLDANALADLKYENKVQLFDRVLPSKDLLPEITVKYLFEIFLLDAQQSSNKEYKTSVLDFLKSLDEDWFLNNRTTLFAILDSTIRDYALRNFMDCNLTPAENDKIASDLSLGFMVKDKAAKKLTIDFVFQNTFTDEMMNFMFDNMRYCTDSESMALICQYLIDKDYQNAGRHIYKLLRAFLDAGKNILVLYKCIDKYCDQFDKTKVTKEMLPILCSRLVEKENQEFCFVLVEKILKVLRNNKEEIQGKDWSLKSIKKIFTKKPDESSNFEKRVSKFSKENTDEWNDFEIE
ncbi:hypothetical protein GINT2_001884 [Glugoides intestinalis]